MYFAPLSVTKLIVSSKNYFYDSSFNTTSWLKIYLLSSDCGVYPVIKDPKCSIFILHGNFTFIFTDKMLR
jgi:hypothetical protein